MYFGSTSLIHSPAFRRDEKKLVSNADSDSHISNVQIEKNYKMLEYLYINFIIPRNIKYHTVLYPFFRVV